MIRIDLKSINYKRINLSHMKSPGSACPEAKKKLTGHFVGPLPRKMGCHVLRLFPAGEVHSFL